ncbi:SLAP domain-containing protein [Neobacillus sp. PS3-34]|uniref:SLAP domain-containing protein n=1 Tax=Neobacillus sp. PS3-34 TaxID=3070678 RepID=UPI0027E16ACE|nr:SLAP domain-containing protein [Neobacillus sp. PS3-34]WML50618.1 SLAP domain-containing protein [Neobacillus sp. PS3-34]
MSQPIRFDSIDLVLLDENENTVAKKQFELDSLGEIPPLSCTPWRFLFSNEDKLAETLPEEGWSIAFELKAPAERKHELDLDDSWESQLTPVQVEQLEKLAGRPAEAGCR